MRSNVRSRLGVAALCALLPFSINAAPVLLSNCPDYDWWYGCTATSAGMLMGFYDYSSYGGLFYDSLIPGGVAELNSYNGQGWNTGQDSDGDTSPDLLCNKAIASADHIADFYTGYGNSGDDPLASGRTRPDDFDCTADYMGTSQDSVSNTDGGTTIYNFTNGAAFAWSHAETYSVEDESGMYGIKEYVEYRGYSVSSLYNQRIYDAGEGWTSGMSFADYQAEIDAGRPSLCHIDGHTMLAYGYDTTGSLVYVYDTWNSGGGSFTWGSSYGGMDHQGFTFFTPSGGSASGGDVPEPATVLLLTMSMGAAAVLRRKRRRSKS